MACVSNCLIVGGGIAGLSAAIALQKVGIQCEVVEIGEEPAGASLSLTGGATAALTELGIYDECYETGAPFTAQMSSPVMNDAAGNPLGAAASRPPASNARPPLGVFRPTFAKVLEAAATREGATIRKGVTVDSLQDDEGGIVVTLSNGETRSPELIIGADGIGSRVRSLIAPEANAPEYSGQMSVRWMIPGPPIDGAGWYVAREGRLGFFHMPKQNFVYAPMVFTMPEEFLSQQRTYEMVSEFLGQFTAPAVVNLLGHLKPDSIFISRPFKWHLLPSPWYRGNILLIGDAAHATTAHMGMGAGMALEDSVVLAQCLSAAASVNEAFDSFMERRFERVRTVVETSIALSKLEQEGAPNSEYMATLGRAYASIAKPF